MQEAEPGPGPALGWSYLVPLLLPDSGPPTHMLSVSRGTIYLFPPLLGPLQSLRGRVSLAPLSPSAPVQAPPTAPAVDFGSPSDTPCCFLAAGTCQRVWAHRGCGCGRTILTASLAGPELMRAFPVPGQRIVFLQRAGGTAVHHPRVPGSCWDGGTQPPLPCARLQDLLSAEGPGRSARLRPGANPDCWAAGIPASNICRLDPEQPPSRTDGILSAQLDLDPLPVTLLPSCQDDLSAPHSHGPQSRPRAPPREAWMPAGLTCGPESYHEDSLAVGTQQMPSKPSAILGPRSPKTQNWAPGHAARPAQLSCLANLAARQGLQGDFELHPPDLLLFYNLTQVKEADCRAFIRRAAQGDTELLANLPNQRTALRHRALVCLGGPQPRLNASDLLLLGVLVCDMDASSIVAADPHVLQNLQHCPRLTAAQQAALNRLLASGRTVLGLPGSWNLEGLQALGRLASYISPRLWMQVQEAVGLDFFRSTVAACRAGQLRQRDARRFVTSFLEAKSKAVSSPSKRDTGRPCVLGSITAATLHDDLFLMRYDCGQLESCLGSSVLRANLDPLLQHPLPAECQQVVKAKLARVYPGGVPEEQLRLIPSLLYLYSLSEIGQWHITSKDTVVTLLAPDGALENQTEAILQKFLDHNGTVTAALLVAIGGSRLCWMSPRQIQDIRPSEFRLAGALDISSCPQTRKNVLFDKAREAFASASTSDTYYRFMRPYLGGAPVEELRHLAEANVSMDIDTFTNLNPRVLQSLTVGNVTTLLGPNVGDLQKARSHPIISSWLRSLNRSALSELGLDTDATSPTSSAHSTTGTPSTTLWTRHQAPTSEGPGSTAPSSGSPPAPLGYLPLAVALPAGLLWLLYGGTPRPSWEHLQGICGMVEDLTAPAPHAGEQGLACGAGRLPRPRRRPQGTWPHPPS
ncbi:mesothelin-like protein [Bubalus bubalis]|uniref:mesothelin-like protein n=1 Tax=Bubalus bubalis TaxID=89462 RepID=UPI001E1B75E7|nr:mesothelin-like protein [Bubalus bubalis]